MTNMCSILKSDSDLKDYRIVTLQNGLKALLISDVHSKQDGERVVDGLSPSSAKQGKETTDESEDDEDENEENEDIDSNPSDVEMGETDTEEEEDDGDEMLVDESGADETDGANIKIKPSQRTEKMAAAALCVGIGSFSDPPDIPGLAHFLEHMVFMGSKKYPDENSFDMFIKKHGGSDNASTDCERTVFQFEVQQKYLKEALLRFAQFFIAPLLKESSTDRELEAVDSEFQMSLPSDTYRKAQLLSSLCNENHPMGKFMWGNTESIKTKPSQNGINVYERLRNFRERNYSSHYMTLVVQSQETLDVLEHWVTSCFSDIPNNEQEKESFSNCGPPFNPEKFQKLYKVVPVKNYHQIEVTWALPPLAKYYRSKPLQYLGWLVGHEGNGSLLALLKKRSLALSLYAGNVESGFEHNSTYSSFGLMVTLTDEGLKQIIEVVKIIFQYIKMLQDAGPNERIYNEIKAIDDNDFRFHEEEEPIELVETLAENMQIYPDEHVLTGHILKFEYDAEIYAHCTNLMTIEKANFILYSKTFADECTEEEYFYKTKYRVSEVPQEWISIVANLELNPELHLPAPNKFIATNFTLKEADRDDTEYPVCILDTPSSKIWYKRDTKFKTPRGYINFHLITPLVNESKTNLVLFDFMVSILEHNLSEVGYDADVADLQYVFKTEETGLLIKVNGFNHKLPDLFQTLVDYLSDFTVTADLFTSVKQSMIRSYYNHNITKSSLNTDVRLAILQERKWIPIDKATVVHDITREKVMDFAAKFRKALYLEGLVQGNFTSKEALGFEEYLRTRLACGCLSPDQLPATRVVQLQKGHHICRVKGLGPVDKNTVVTNYYQWGPGTVEKYSLLNALVVMMEEPCFDVLRTQEQLGYSVHATCRNTFGILGFSVTVTTQATKFSASHVDGRIDEFLQHFHNKVLASLPEDVFREQIQGLINLKMCADLHLGEEVKRNWFEVKDRSYVFDRSQREVEYLRKLTLEDVTSFLAEHLKNGGNRRKLSVQVIGAGKREQFNLLDSDREVGEVLEDVDETDASQKGNESSKLELEMLPLENGYSGRQIKDITSFKQDLVLYPLSKLDH